MNIIMTLAINDTIQYSYIILFKIHPLESRNKAQVIRRRSV